MREKGAKVIKNRIYWILVLVLVGCGDESSSGANSDEINPEIVFNDEIKSFDTPLNAIYNQAYQENFEADTMEYIVKNAKNAYVLVDVFSNFPDVKPYIEKIKQNNNEISGYISAGTAENDRDDFNDLEPYIVSKAWEEWNNEFFINDTKGVLEIMKKRIDKMAKLGLDWVEFDNMDWGEDDENRKKYGLSVTE